MDKSTAVHTDSGILKRNELSSHKKTSGKLKCTLLVKEDKSAKAAHCVIPATRRSGKGETTETV